MSDAVWIALIAAWTAGWHDLVDLAKSQIGITVAGFIGLVGKQWWDAKQAKKAREEIKAQLAENTRMTETGVFTKEHAELMIAGAERANVSKGIEIGKQQATGPAPLG